MKKYKLDLITIPDEFKDLEVEKDFKPVKSGKLVPKRKRILTKSDKNILNYDAWRTFDRTLVVPTGKAKAVCKLMLPPALLKKAFGTPGDT